MSFFFTVAEIHAFITLASEFFLLLILGRVQKAIAYGLILFKTMLAVAGIIICCLRFVWLKGSTAKNVLHLGYCAVIVATNFLEGWKACFIYACTSYSPPT